MVLKGATSDLAQLQFDQFACFSARISLLGTGKE
jgi:hypothetical protein